jgi:hypothetical protein
LKKSVQSKFFQSAQWTFGTFGRFSLPPFFQRLHRRLWRRLWQSRIPAYALIWSLQLLLLLEEDAAMLAFCFSS